MNAEAALPEDRPRRHPDRRARRTSGIAIALALAALISVPVVQAQKAKLTETDIVKLLKGFVAPDRVATLAKDRGISFQVTPEVERLLREAGANDNLVGTLKQLAPKLSPPQLMIHSTPGHAQVYIDDVPIGTTSAEGTLKLPSLSAGDHKVRLSLEKFNDYEVVAKLVTGETTSLDAALQAAAPPPKVASSSPKPIPNPPPTLIAAKDKLKTFDGTVVKDKNAKYVLVAKETLRKKVYDVEPQQMFASFAGQRVRVTGVKDGDSITAQSVEPR